MVGKGQIAAVVEFWSERVRRDEEHERRGNTPVFFLSQQMICFNRARLAHAKYIKQILDWTHV